MVVGCAAKEPNYLRPAGRVVRANSLGGTSFPAATLATSVMNMLARSPLLVFALLVAGMALGFATVRGDELPKDTNKIKSLTPEQARKLAEEFRGVHVSVSISTDDVMLPCRRGWSHGLPLQGITTLDPKTAKELARFKGNAILLTGLSSFDIDTAKSFTTFRSDVVVPEEVRKTFCTKNPLTPETALVWAVVARDELSRVPVLKVAIAKAFAEFKGHSLHLDGLTTLDVDTAKTIAEFKSDYLFLDGLTTLDAATTKALAEFKGRQIFLNGLTTLDAGAAKALAATEKWNGDLPTVTAFDSPDSVAVAEALAIRKGPLKLPNLKKISPKTLSALIEKEDVEIPLIETLELIPEPDGSVTEDFVIPEDFQNGRQRQSK